VAKVVQLMVEGSWQHHLLMLQPEVVVEHPLERP